MYFIIVSDNHSHKMDNLILYLSNERKYTEIGESNIILTEFIKTTNVNLKVIRHNIKRRNWSFIINL